MTPAGEILRDLIARSGPVPFHVFMETALYHPEHGYYRRGRDPFGKDGDYYTAEQVQPVFGRLMRALVRQLWREAGLTGRPRVVELGAGRGEMSEAFGEFDYTPVEAGGEPPDQIRGAVFANEFFDALPVHVVTRRKGALRNLRVDYRQERFVWVEGEPAPEEVVAYVRDYASPLEEGARIEVNLDALRWLDRIADCLEDGYLLVFDYGYQSRELRRYPEGTLMSYRRHRAKEDVLSEPGEQDITAHVNFSALEQYGLTRGLARQRFETMAAALLRAGEPDQFSEALRASGEKEQLRLRLQLKTLLFGMGEGFRSLLMRPDKAAKQ